MRKKLKTIITSIVIVAFGVSASAQQDYAVKSIVTQTPVSFTKQSDIVFNNVEIQANAHYDVIIPPSEEVDKSDNIARRGQITESAASFMLTGQEGYLYAITLPESCVMNNDGKHIVVDQFTSVPSLAGMLNEKGFQQLKIGATFKISAMSMHSLASPTCIRWAQVTINYN